MNYQNMSVEEAKKVIQQSFETLSQDLMEDDSLPINARRDLLLTLCGWDAIEPMLTVYTDFLNEYIEEIKPDPKKGIDESLSFKYAREMLNVLARSYPDYEAFSRSESAVDYTAYIGFFNIGLKKFCEKKEASK